MEGRCVWIQISLLIWRILNEMIEIIDVLGSKCRVNFFIFIVISYDQYPDVQQVDSTVWKAYCESCPTLLTVLARSARSTGPPEDVAIDVYIYMTRHSRL